MTTRRLADRPTWLINRTSARAQGLLAEAFTQAGVRGYHFRILAALEEEGPCSQADLGRATDIDRSDVVAVLDDLAARGWARRDPDPADRRRNVVSITDAGLTRLDALDDLVGRVQDELLAPLSAAERTTLVRLLQKLTP